MPEQGQEHTTSGPARKRHGVVSALICVLAGATVLHSPVQAAPPGAVQVPDDGYLYALDDEELTDAEDGLTIEFWLLLTDNPGDNVVWPLIAKEDYYAIALFGHEALRPEAPDKPDREMRLGWSVYAHREGGGLSSGIGLTFRPGGRHAWPLEAWVHIAQQIKGVKSPVQEVYFNGELISSSGVGGGDPGSARNDLPLFVAGLSPDAIHLTADLEWLAWEVPERQDFGTVDGWIDEVRVSRGWRYGAQRIADLNPRQGRGPDDDTIALWTFDHEPVQGRYEDVSGNGHALFLGRSLAVSARGRLAATWAQLKRQ